MSRERPGSGAGALRVEPVGGDGTRQRGPRDAPGLSLGGASRTPCTGENTLCTTHFDRSSGWKANLNRTSILAVPPSVHAERRALAAATREIRARQQLSQEQVADRGGIGRKYVGQIERGEIVPSFAALVGIARGLEVALSELIRVYEQRLAADAGAAASG